MLRRLTLIALVCVFLFSAPVLGKPWRGITPLRSTRADVERLLGAPEPGTGTVYKTTDEMVKVTYASIECDYGWRVRPNTVVSVLITPNKPPKFSELKLVEKKYQKRRDPSYQNVYYYVNEREGINYTVDESAGVVTTIEYYPVAADKRLKCKPKGPAVKPETTRSQS